MLEYVAYGALAATWLACLFQMLQLADQRRRRGLLVSLAVALAGVGAIALRSSQPGFDWLRSADLRSDALALGTLVPLLAVAVGTWSVDRSGRAGTIAPIIIAGLCSVIVGMAALAIGRAGWYWEFVLVVAAGAVLMITGWQGMRRTESGANTRFIAASVGVLGAFFVLAGSLLWLAWQSID